MQDFRTQFLEQKWTKADQREADKAREKYQKAKKAPFIKMLTLADLRGFWPLLSREDDEDE